MALSTPVTTTTTTTPHHRLPQLFRSHSSTITFPAKPTSTTTIATTTTTTIATTTTHHNLSLTKWRAGVSFFPAFLNRSKNAESIKQELLDAIAPLDRGADASPEDQQSIEQVTADLTPVNARKVAVKFDYFKILGLIPVKAPDSARGSLEITYLDEELRVSRGDKGNLFILRMIDPSYRVPV